MIERQFLANLQRMWKTGQVGIAKVSDEALALSKLAVDTYPRSVDLLCMRGYVLSMAAGFSTRIRRQAISCFKKAVRIDPECVDALEELGYCHDILDEYEAAEVAFRQALACGGSPYVFAGLARLLQERGDTPGALKLLSSRSCPFQEHPAVKQMRAEIRKREWEPMEPFTEAPKRANRRNHKRPTGERQQRRRR